MLPRLRTLTLKSGERFTIRDGVTVVTGPNNSGKSLLLQELTWLLGRGPGAGNPQTAILQDVSVEWPGDEDALVEWLGAQFDGWRPPGEYRDGGWGERTVAIPQGGVLTESQVRAAREQTIGTGQLGTLALHFLDTQGRLQHNFGAQAINPRVATPNTPAQRLFADRDLATRVSAELKRAFSIGMTVDRYAATEIPLLLGELATAETRPPPSKEYLAELESLPPLTAQGDGYRAFSNILIQMTTSGSQIILIDEPEAFLHPPQARLLGRMLAEKVQAGRQVVLSTHSTDIIEGLTSVRPPTSSVEVLRLTRKQNLSSLAHVEPDKVRELYDDALLRYARILSGLFSDGTIVCEGDSDCTYYEAVSDYLEGNLPGPDSSTSTTSGASYVHTSGKARIAKAVAALKAARVPTVSIVDFDILRGADEFYRLVEAHEGDRTTLVPLRNQISAAIESNRPGKSRVALRAELLEVLDRGSGPTLSTSELDRLRNLANPGDSGWRAAKRSGRDFLSGDAANSFDELSRTCEGIGLFIVPVGELEMFHREIPSGDKPAWLRMVLESGAFRGPSKSHDLMHRVIAYIRSQQ